MLIPALSKSDLEKNGGAENGSFNTVLCIFQGNFEAIPIQRFLNFVLFPKNHEITSDKAPETNRSKSHPLRAFHSSLVFAYRAAHNCDNGLQTKKFTNCPPVVEKVIVGCGETAEGFIAMQGVQGVEKEPIYVEGSLS